MHIAHDSSGVDNIRFGALAVIDTTLEKTIAAGTDLKNWFDEDKMNHVLFLDVRDEILRQVMRTFAKRLRSARRNEVGATDQRAEAALLPSEKSLKFHGREGEFGGASIRDTRARVK